MFLPMLLKMVAGSSTYQLPVDSYSLADDLLLLFLENV